MRVSIATAIHSQHAPHYSSIPRLRRSFPFGWPTKACLINQFVYVCILKISDTIRSIWIGSFQTNFDRGMIYSWYRYLQIDFDLPSLPFCLLLSRCYMNVRVSGFCKVVARVAPWLLTLFYFRRAESEICNHFSRKFHLLSKPTSFGFFPLFKMFIFILL